MSIWYKKERIFLPTSSRYRCFMSFIACYAGHEGLKQKVLMSQARSRLWGRQLPPLYWKRWPYRKRQQWLPEKKIPQHFFFWYISAYFVRNMLFWYRAENSSCCIQGYALKSTKPDEFKSPSSSSFGRLLKTTTKREKTIQHYFRQCVCLYVDQSESRWCVVAAAVVQCAWLH